MPKSMNAHTTAFDKKNALLMNQLSCLVYTTDFNILQSKVKKFGFPNCKPVEDISTGTYGMVVWDDEAVVIVFRGTENLKDWMTDAHIMLEDGIRGKVHFGFNNALKSVWDRLNFILNPLWNSNENRSYWLTGHSLGAALTTLAAANLVLGEHDHPVNGVYTYGSPRVGNETFADAYNKILKSRTFRFVNNNDIVTRIPPRTFSYRHVGTFMYLTEECKIKQDIHFWNLFLDRVKGDLAAFMHLKLDATDDHHCGNYLDCMIRAVTRS